MFGYDVNKNICSILKEENKLQRLLIKCAVDKKPVEIIYQSKKGTISQRTILIKKVNHQQILAYCYQKRQIRSFIIEQILAAQPVKKRFTTSA